jgi:hypothetical protein
VILCSPPLSHHKNLVLEIEKHMHSIYWAIQKHTDTFCMNQKKTGEIQTGCKNVIWAICSISDKIRWDNGGLHIFFFWRIMQTVTVIYFTLMNDSDRETAVLIQISHIHKKKAVLNELLFYSVCTFYWTWNVTSVLHQIWKMRTQQRNVRIQVFTTV